MEEVRFEKTAFLVKDDSIPDYYSEFMSWLRSEGFRCGVQKKNWGCSWIFVSITNKMVLHQELCRVPGEVEGPSCGEEAVLAVVSFCWCVRREGEVEETSAPSHSRGRYVFRAHRRRGRLS